MEKVVALCKRRGFVYPSSEIYGGLSGFYDYGPYGIALKRNIRALWWRHNVELRDDVVGLESTLIMHPEVWVASGHVDNFVDPLVQCLGECKRRYRADQLSSDRCPQCGGELSEARMFNLMFATNIGPVEDSASRAYLRPETAQGMFVDFKNVLNSMRVRVPFGIAQQGRAFRNEITPGNFVFRLREFELMEIEFFVKPGTDDHWFQYWRQLRMDWYTKVLGVHSERLRFFDHPKASLSHYSKQTTDIEYEFPFAWGELEGVADRTDFDLRVHQEHSGEDLSYLDPETNERYLPWVIEPAVSVERILITLLLDAYDEEDVRGETRVLLRFHRDVAPVQVAVMPLSKKEELIAPAREVMGLLKPWYRTEYDQTGGNIGRRYRRQDEIGTPFCITVDFDTLNDRAVTIRERDSMEQERVPVAGLVDRLRERFG
ncbi:MAG: glycine--tRNA ligase [Chloroflexi bacterium]|nr:MAG: glycine--tRNA ligase [Chloroflexota bacterium]